MRRQKWNLKFVESAKNYTFLSWKIPTLCEISFTKVNCVTGRQNQTVLFNILKTKCNYEEAPGIDKTRFANYQENLQILDIESNSVNTDLHTSRQKTASNTN